MTRTALTFGTLAFGAALTLLGGCVGPYDSGYNGGGYIDVVGRLDDTWRRGDTGLRSSLHYLRVPIEVSLSAWW